MPDEIAVRFDSVIKEYKLYPNATLMALDTLGIPFINAKKRRECKTFRALNGVSFDLKRGERMGVIGRNGAGKTTLLKLVTGNFTPTTGTVIVNGKVQSLMDAGLGFHPEFTGMENIKASLIYNGLSAKETELAVADIVDFVELKDFLHQPIKTYSLGMATRLAFATATAIKPEILIIDEVLGAGDGYFSAKSADRMRRLTRNGTTLILVSHSLEQIIQYCDTGLWINQGSVVMKGDVLEVVKAYDNYLLKLDENRIKHNNEVGTTPPQIEADWFANAESSARAISKWDGLTGLKINFVSILNSEGHDAVVIPEGDAIDFRMSIRAEVSGSFECQYHIYVYTLDGKRVSVHLSDPDHFQLEKDQTRNVRLHYDRTLLGPGDYVITAGLFKALDLRDTRNSERYDIWDRSFQFKVTSAFKEDYSLVRHPAIWLTENGKRLTDFTEKAVSHTKSDFSLRPTSEPNT